MLSNFFTIDKQYRENTRQYTPLDGIIAVIYYALIMGVYYGMGVIYDTKNLYYGELVNLTLAAICVLILLIRKQKLSSIGFTIKNFTKSLILGLLFGGVVFTLNLVLGLLNGGQFQTASILIKRFFYYFITIGLVEEIIFRGFIQTRIFGIVKKPMLAILLTALMFMAMHIPFQMGAAHMGFFEYIVNNFITIIITFVWHFVFQFLYAKYNSIVAPTVFHTFMNWSNYLFK